MTTSAAPGPLLPTRAACVLAASAGPHPGLSGRVARAIRAFARWPDLKDRIKTSVSPPPIEIGKYLVSPLSKRLSDDTRYTASVSIRSGQGSATHDRVLRLLPLFDSRDDALSYALREGMAWVHERTPAAPRRTSPLVD